MRILLDLDGTVAHFDRKYDILLDQHASEHAITIPRTVDQIEFNLWNGRTPEEQQVIREVMNMPGFYRDLEVMDGAVEAVHGMVDAGHEVFFLSAPWTTNPSCASDKYAWVEEKFGEGWANRLILAKDKTVVSGDILFDDKDPIPNKERADWTQVFFDQPYNRNAEGHRIHDWEQWAEVAEAVYWYRVIRNRAVAV